MAALNNIPVFLPVRQGSNEGECEEVVLAIDAGAGFTKYDDILQRPQFSVQVGT